MGLRSMFIGWLAAKLADAAGWQVSQFQSGRVYNPDTDYSALVKKYSGWVYACAQRNAVTCAQIPLRLYGAKPSGKSKGTFQTRKLSSKQREYITTSPSAQRFLRKAVDIEEVMEHPFLDLMANVNEFINGFDLLEGLFTCQDLTGNAYWVVDKGESGLPSTIWPMMPQYISIVPNKARYIQHYEYKQGIEKHIIDPEFMIHFKYFNPTSSFYGMGPLQAAILPADLAENMNRYETTLMQNDARPDMALIFPETAGSPSDEEEHRIAKSWRLKHGGKRKGNLAILSGGAELKQINFTPREISYLQGHKTTREEIAAIFGVPLSLLTTESVNLANAKEGNHAYMALTIHPRLIRAEQKLNEKLLPMYDDRLFCAFDNPVPADKEFRLKERESNLKTGYSSINIERQADDQKEVEWGEVPILPTMMAPLGSVDTANNAQDAASAPKTVKAARKYPPLQHPTNFVNIPLKNAIAEFFAEQGEYILNQADKADYKMVKVNAGDLISSWFDMQKWNLALAAKTTPFVRATFMVGGQRALKQLTSELQFDPIQGSVLQAAEAHKGAIELINSTTTNSVRLAVEAGLANGEGPKAIRGRIQQVFVNAEKYRAERIARTETIWAWNEGAVEGYKQSGVVTRKEWSTSEDDRTCPWCAEMDGKTVEVEAHYFDKGGNMVVDDQSLNFDYEAIDHPPLHPGCRCAIVPVVEEI